MDGTTKPSFMDVFVESQLGWGMVRTVAELSHIPMYTVNDLIVGNPVAGSDAQAVLNILGQHMGKTLILADVDIPTLPRKEEEVQRG